MKQDFDVVIIGAGVSGMTSAIYLKRAGINCCLIEKGMPGGQINLSPSVENYPGFTKVAGMELTMKMFKQITDLGVSYINEEVKGISLDGDNKIITTSKNKIIAKKVIIALGRHPRKLAIDNIDNLVGRGVSYCATCDGNFFKEKDVVVVGGSNSALEEALYLSGICQKVTIVHRKDKFTAEQIYIDKLKTLNNVQVEFNSEVIQLIEEDNKLSKIVIDKNGAQKVLEASGLFTYIGYEPSSKLVADLVELDNYGYIKVNSDNETNIKGIYAVGDIVNKPYFQLITAMNDGVIAANACIKKLK